MNGQGQYYKNGWKAYTEKRPKKDNPYNADSFAWIEWNSGWDAASERKHNKKTINTWSVIIGLLALFLVALCCTIIGFL